MDVIIKLAWKNLWREKRRSILMTGIIAIGVFAGTFVVAFINGWMENGIDEHTRMQTSHLQIHAKGYTDANDTGKLMDKRKVEDAIANVEGIANVSHRLKVNALLTTAETSVGLVLMGVDADDEKKVSDIEKTIGTGNGTFLADETDHPIVISRHTAQKLNTRLNSKIIVAFQAPNGEMQEVMFRVGGIYHTNSKRFDNATAFARKENLQPYMYISPYDIHETAIILRHFDQCRAVKETMAKVMKNFSIQSWNEVYPLLEVLSAWREISNILLLGIFFSAQAFGIMNFMLMSVMEREAELKMLERIGTSRRRIAYMIRTETVALLAIGTTAGIALCMMAVAHFSKHGFDISFLLSDDVNYGFSSVIYPQMAFSNFMEIVAFVFLTGLFASTIPIRKITHTHKDKQ
ncbi:MAG: ABC transporter permease [Prevotellaceae bacterium]|nr:ABC transporter permease [Prevotellaceae bacterium]